MYKRKRNNISLAVYYIKIAHQIDKFYIPVFFLCSLIHAFSAAINIIVPKYIIDEMIKGQNIEKLILLVSFVVILNFVLKILGDFLNSKKTIKNKKIVIGFESFLGEKIMNVKYEMTEDPHILDLREKALYPIKNQFVFEQMLQNILSGIQNIITLITLMIILSTLSVDLMFFLLILVVLNVFVNKKNQKNENKFIMEIVKDNREMAYYRGLCADFSTGKDIRLYDMQGLILSKIKDYIDRSTTLFKKLMSKNGFWTGISNINLQLQMSIIYAYITYKVVLESISIGSFLMYINASLKFCNILSCLFENVLKFQQMSQFLVPYKEFEKICESNSINSINGINGDLLGKQICIEFKNVFFKYPHSDEYSIKNLSIKIMSGEKLSIVGVNGAGKTTFIKLLCRFYEPTEGEITINGININKIRYDEYIKCINTIFQDFKLFAFSISENIALNSRIDDKKIHKILKDVGLSKKFNGDSDAINISLYKMFDDKGIDLSGGESQKLAIARALYGESKVIILDEPTASLDPVAENEIFRRINLLKNDKTIIFISHRLSSCRFCDKIAVFDKGSIVQYGTHRTLIEEKNGKYYELFNSQAKFYNDNNIS